MAETPDDKDMEQTKRIMERLLKTPPDPKGGKEKGDDRSRRPPYSHQDRENGSDAKKA